VATSKTKPRMRSLWTTLGLNQGEAHVIRNAGGVVTQDEIRSLAISQRLLGTEVDVDLLLPCVQVRLYRLGCVS
jgi:hypothetical protein